MATIGCPCHEFETVQAIHRALDSEESTRRIVEWLSSGNDGSHRFACRNSSNSLRCVHRVGRAFVILNEIRDACRHHLETSSSNVASLEKQSTGLGVEQSTEPRTYSYEEAFPSLGSSSASAATTLLVGRKKQKSADAASSKENAKPKRRIRPAPSTNSSTATPPRVWATAPAAYVKGNISETPLTMRDKKSAVGAEPMLGPRTTPKKTKKKIAPTLLASPTGLKASGTSVGNVWTPGSFKGNISNSTSEEAHNLKIMSRLHPEGTSNTVPATREDKSFRKLKPEANEAICSVGVAVPAIGNRDVAKTGESTEKELERLVDVYSTILQHHLVPSTALEIHLLLRLLAVPDDSCVPLDDSNSLVFASLFSTGTNCQKFAVRALYRIKRILRNLGFDLVKALAECPPFQKLLPELAEELLSLAESRHQAALLMEVDSHSSIAGNTQTPMLTLPFEHDRDSRHNYTSREEASLYKNREESRDAFLYQLRAFQNVRGRVVDAVQAERSLHRIRVASRDVVQGLFATNMFWFAQMFCDLLLQIGLVPMEETDKEILNITDKEKLQKLHRRFSAKERKTNKSSLKLVLDPKDRTRSSSVAQPQQFFPGHQEFFFVFIQSADSYSFGMQLKNRLVGIISDLTSVHGAKGLEQRLLNLQLLAKFLGVLVFSPNWPGTSKGTVGVSSGAKAFSSEDAISHLDAMQPVLPLVRYVEDAWKERHLVAVVPWVVEFLRMLRWDDLSQRSSYYQGLFARLRAIHQRIGNEDSSSTDFMKVNMQLMSFYLETLFADIIGLGNASLLPPARLSEQVELSSEGSERAQLDSSPLLFSKALLLTSNAYIEELFVLVSTLADSKGKAVATGGASRKMRPYSISGAANGISSLSLTEAYSTGVTAVHDRTSSTELPRDSSGPENGEKAAVQRKLVDAFFHQHQYLKELCDFVVDKCLKSSVFLLTERCIVPVFEKELSSMEASAKDTATTSDAFNKALTGSEHDASVAAREFLRETLVHTIHESLVLLSPPDSHKRVTEVATCLAVSHGVRLGETMIDGLVRCESKKKRDAYTRKERKQLTASNATQSGRVEITPHVPATDSLNKLADLLIEQQWEQKGAAHLVRNATDSVSAWISSSGGMQDSSHSVRDFSSKFDPCGPYVVSALESSLFQSSVDIEMPLGFTFQLLGLVVILGKGGFSRRVVKNVSTFLCQEGGLEKLIELGLEAQTSTGNVEELGELIVAMVEVKLIDSTRLEQALICSLNELDPTGVLSLYCLRKLGQNRCGSCPMNNGKSSMIMPRLQSDLSRQDKS